MNENHKSAAFYTIGCKLNYSETSTIGKSFTERGFEIVNFEDRADVYVINTCTVTASAEKDCRHIVRKLLKQNPSAFIAVTGCYAQLRPEEIVKIPGVDIVLGANEKFKLFDLIENFDKNINACVYVSDLENDKLEFQIASSSDDDSRTRAFLKIQDGCDYPCTYCTIPFARGKSRSTTLENAVKNLKELLESGYKEIVLTGVNIGEYNDGGASFFDLVKSLIAVEGDFRLRISSIEPNLVTDELIELVANSDKLCRHFHIPLQSGSPKILKLMQRRYTAPFYINLVNKILERIPDAGIGVDVIVGFPSETDDDFNETYSLLNNLKISYLHAFTYSERPDTKALSIDGKVDVAKRRERNKKLRLLSDKKRNEFYDSSIGKLVEPLFEKENINGYVKGFTSNYIKVFTKFDDKLFNSFRKVIITENSSTHCYAELI